MAVPTLTACSPATVFTGGQLVTLTGTGFQVAYPAPNTNGPTPDPLPTVAITFNSKAAKKVRVLSSVSLTCIAPPGSEGAASVNLKNLDTLGAPIAGEAVTSVVVATYARADLSVQDDLERVVREFLQLLKREVIPNVTQTVSADYTDSAGKLEFDITDIASLPCVSVTGPMLKRNKFYGEASEIEQRGTSFVQRRYLRTSDLVFKVSGYDNLTARLLRLQSLLTKVLELNTFFEVPRDASDPSKGSVFYELDADDFGWSTSPNNSDVRGFSGEVTVRGFTFEDVAGFADSQVATKGDQAGTITVTATKFDP